MLRDCGLRTRWDLDYPVVHVDLLLGTERPGWITPSARDMNRRAAAALARHRSVRLAPVSHVLVAAAVFHDRSKTPFFIAAGVLVVWAILVSAAGIRS